MDQVILRLPVVKARIGLSRSAIYSLVSRGEFPRPVQLGARSVGWVEDEVASWVKERIAARPEARRAA
jgi:prophage regulatory protein